MNKVNINDVLKHLVKNKVKFIFEGNRDIVLDNVSNITELKEYGLSFYNSDDIENIIKVTNRKNLIILKESLKKNQFEGNIIYTDNPSLCFNIVGWLFKAKREGNIHKTSIIGNNVVTGKNFNIGANSVIGDGVKIGDNVDVGENCIVKNSKIGNNVRIQAGAKIGSMGFGSYKRENGEWVDFPHFGSVTIEDNVVIQDNVVINRGSLNTTIIRENSRIGPLSCIAHGVVIGKSCFVSQAVIIAGSVKVGHNSNIWGNSAIRNGVKIGNLCEVGMGSIVTKNIPDNETWVGNPAKKHTKNGNR